MKPPDFSSAAVKGFCRRAPGGFTLVEFLVASSISLVVAGCALTFITLAGISISGISAQNAANTKAGYVLELLQTRMRLATSVSNSPSGNSLTLGFDDNVTVDSDADGKPYNDKNHYERFQFIGVNSTNALLCATNKLVYTSNITTRSNRVLVGRGVRNLPRYNIFTLTNQTTIIVRFGIVDTYARDYYQGVDVQGTAISLNRPSTTNIVSILP